MFVLSGQMFGVKMGLRSTSLVSLLVSPETSLFLPHILSSFLSLNNLGGQVSLEELGHPEGTDLVLSEGGDHLGVGCEVLLVLGVLELLALDVSPEALDNRGSGELLSLLGSNKVSELSTEVERLGESASLGHLDSL